MTYLSRQLLDELISDNRVLDRVKVELYLPVKLGLRQCAIIELPGSLPDGSQLADMVNEGCKEDYKLVLEEQDPVKKWPLIVALKNNLQKGFKEVVMRSESYIALICWEKRLGLRRYEAALRPTIHEVYVYRDITMWWSIRHLVHQRLRLRSEAIRNLQYHEIAAYPEEFSPKYLRETGRLLGYPSCCIEAYVSDRVAGNVVEMRLSEQLQSLIAEEKMPEPYSFFTRNFYPCRPGCPEAEKIGLNFLRTLNCLDTRLGQLYEKCLEENLDLVQNYRKYLARHLAEMEKRLMEVWVEKLGRKDSSTFI